MNIPRRFCALALLSAVAGITSSGLGATSDTLNNLVSGSGSISAGVATYSGFGYGGTTDSSTVQASASIDGAGNSVITFTRTAGTWTQSDGNSVIWFHVDFSMPIVLTGLEFDATAIGTVVSSVGETITDGITDVPYLPGLQVYVNGAGGQQLTDAKVFGTPVSSLDIVKSIDIAANGGTGTITFVDNSFTPIPEPASLGIIAMAGAGLLWRHRRRI